MICVFLDTNLLFSKSTDFTKARFLEKVEDLVSEIEVNDLYSNVKLIIPQIVIEELRRQQIDEFADAIKEITKYKVSNTRIEYPEDYDATCNTLFEKALSSLKGGMVKVEIAPYPPKEAFEPLIIRVINKLPPFEGKSKQSDKGFKDALIWESIKAYKSSHSDDIIVLYSQDNRLTIEQLEKEFESVFSEKIVMVRKNNQNSHDDIIDKLRELSNVEEKHVSFIQELKDRLIELLREIPSDYIMEYGHEIDYDGDRFFVDSCNVDGSKINEITEHEGIVEFSVTLLISFDFHSDYEEFGSDRFESNATVNYELATSTFYFKGSEDFDGNYGEFEGLGAEM